MPLKQAIAIALDAVFPPRCPLCGDSVVHDGGLCGACWAGLAMPGEPCCGRCQRPFASAALADAAFDRAVDSDAQPGICATCAAAPPLHDGIAAATVYNRTSRQLVLAFKHGGRVALAPMLGRLMAARLHDVDTGWMIVPVPLHRWRLWARGYNQSALLAAHIARHKGARLLVDGLQRGRSTPSLAGLGGVERARVLDGAIRVSKRGLARFAGADVVLVDDVLTSGATTNACIAALRGAGAARVRVACFARVLRQGGMGDVDGASDA